MKPNLLLSAALTLIAAGCCGQPQQAAPAQSKTDSTFGVKDPGPNGAPGPATNAVAPNAPDGYPPTTNK